MFDVGCFSAFITYPFRRTTGFSIQPSAFYLLIPIAPPQTPILDQASLSKSLSCGFAAVPRGSGLNVGGWRLDEHAVEFMHSREFLRRYERLPQVKKAELIEGVVYCMGDLRDKRRAYCYSGARSSVR